MVNHSMKSSCCRKKEEIGFRADIVKSEKVCMNVNKISCICTTKEIKRKKIHRSDIIYAHRMKKRKKRQERKRYNWCKTLRKMTMTATTTTTKATAATNAWQEKTGFIYGTYRESRKHLLRVSLYTTGP